MFMILWVKGFDSALGIPCLKPPLERVITETDSKVGVAGAEDVLPQNW